MMIWCCSKNLSCRNNLFHKKITCREKREMGTEKITLCFWVTHSLNKYMPLFGFLLLSSSLLRVCQRNITSKKVIISATFVCEVMAWTKIVYCTSPPSTTVAYHSQALILFIFKLFYSNPSTHHALLSFVRFLSKMEYYIYVGGREGKFNNEKSKLEMDGRRLRIFLLSLTISDKRIFMSFPSKN